MPPCTETAPPVCVNVPTPPSDPMMTFPPPSLVRLAFPLSVYGEVWVGQGAGSRGIYTHSGGSLTLSNWLAIGEAGEAGS